MLLINRVKCQKKMLLELKADVKADIWGEKC